ncbi:solute carrier family 12 member 1-like [Dreissena polymorpha]|uniref:Solute carrier family 12 member 2 n=1 Tax=Dreissena polymorpha TaxID=45954 RepID=A0A9D4KDX2_DREPO|nr:solute carrier family 12 member 1-like [Dreissena polymorpha]KAH3837753.1 hypothetical protein DPMN_111154 [Dreissena polymorpha]
METNDSNAETLNENFDAPEILVTAVDSDDEMGDVDAPTDIQIPFAKYAQDNDTNSDNATGLAQDKGAKLDSKSEGGDSRSRKTSKVSFHSDVKSQSLPNSRKVSAHCYGSPQRGEGVYIAPVHELYPVYSGISFAPHAHGNVRKLSAQPMSYYPDAPHASRKSSVEPFYLSPQHMADRLSRACMHAIHGGMHPKVSVFSMGNYSDGVFSGGDEGESMPTLDHYRVSVVDNQRSTLYQLREEAMKAKGDAANEIFADELCDDADEEKASKSTDVKKGGLKFGWIAGVMLRCLMNMFGVMLFLRITWVTGQAGIGLATLIVLLSATVTSLTTISMSAICTNGEVKGGGAYYLISRSLGPQFGGSIGIVFTLANAVGAAMHIVGFAETVRDIMWEHGAYITGDSIHEVRIIGLVTGVVCLAIILIGMAWEAKAQLVLLVILIAALVNFFVGTFLPRSDELRWKGVVGYSGETFKTNFVPHFSKEHNFFSVFAIFFPSATGIMAGANLSGDLKDPQSAIPKGTFLAILLASLTNIALVWAMGGSMALEAVGTAVTMATGNTTVNVTSLSVPTLEAIQLCGASVCKYGLLHDFGITGLASAWRPLIIAGIFAATLSSALGSLVSAPKIFQALCKDRLFPFIHVFAKSYGANGDPRRAYILCSFICLAIVCIGSLDIIAPIISNFFLMVYAMVNFSCFNASMANTPGFRPGFKLYNKWLSLLGSLLCMAAMFLINWWAALVTYAIVAGVYLYIKVSKPDVNWGSSTQAIVYSDALKTTLKLINIDDHVKNFRPQILVLTGYPRNRPNLLDFAATITKKQSLLISGHVFKGDLEEHLARLRSMSVYRWFSARKVKAFYNSVCAPTFRIGVQVLLQALGVGKLRPNTLLLGYKNDWQKADPLEVLDYFNVITDAFDLRYSVGILRVAGGFDRNKVPDDVIDLDNPEVNESDENIEEEDDDELQTNDVTAKPVDVKTNTQLNGQPHFVHHRLNTLEEGIENAAFQDDDAKPDGVERTAPVFRESQYGTVDVWWLYDDGGMTLLVPYILSQRKQWKNAKLRVFCLGTKKEEVAEDQMRMASLLAKFRINYSELTILTEMNKKPQLKTYRQFETLIGKWRLKAGEFQEDYPWKIADADLMEYKQKTYTNLRIREKLLEHSMDASLIVMTLPVPRKTACPAGLYLGWLEILTRDLPPTLLLRGNQESVLTYYS